MKNVLNLKKVEFAKYQNVKLINLLILFNK